MTKFHRLAAAAALSVGVFALANGAASARIVCNEDGDCWHTHGDIQILPGLALTTHPDDWSWGDEHRYHWREHEGNGYWNHGEWHDE